MGKQIPNIEQDPLADYLLSKIKEIKNQSIPTNYSMTYVPHYDTTITSKMKWCLDRVKVHESIEPKVNSYKMEGQSKLI